MHSTKEQAVKAHENMRAKHIPPVWTSCTKLTNLGDRGRVDRKGR